MTVSHLRLALLSPFFLLVTLWLGCDGRLSDSEARGQAKVLRQELNKEEQRIVVLEKERKSLEEENRRLQRELALATGGKGLDVQERQRLLDDRKAGLDHLEKQLTERKKGIRQREVQLERLHLEFYERTNMTMEDIGEAKHIKAEYENMRSEKDAAVAKAERWLEFVWGVSIALGIAILACCILLYRSLSMHKSHERETESRRAAAELFGGLMSARLPREQALTVVDAFHRFAQIEGKPDSDDSDDQASAS